MNPAKVPQAGPRIGAVKAEDTTLAMVTTATVPRIGNAGNKPHTITTALHVPVKAKNTEFVMYLWTLNIQSPDPRCLSLCKKIHKANKTCVAPFILTEFSQVVWCAYVEFFIAL